MLLDFAALSLDEVLEQCLQKGESSDELMTQLISFLQKWKEEDPIFSIYSSGSTGPPKELFFRKRSLETSALISIKTFDLKKGDIALLCLPLNFVAGKLMLVRAIVGKLKLKITDPSSNPLQKIVEDIDFAAFTPYQISVILDENKDKLDLISKIILGGSKVSSSLEEKLKGCRSDIYETFGMSETLTHCAIRKLSDKGSKFKIVEGFKWELNTDGCLELSAPHLPLSPIKTNDVVKKEDEDHFTWLGRKDNVINSGGVKLYPETIERKLQEVFSFSLVVGKEEDDLLGEKAILYIEESVRNEFDQSIYDTISFDKYEKPKEVRFISQIPRNSNGKIERKKLNEQ